MTQTTFTHNLIVSGTYLVWKGSYKFQGAQIPASDLTAVSGLSPGRIFVSNLSNNLHYVDEFNTLRFVDGIGDGATALPDGRIYFSDPTCEAAGEVPFNIYWTVGGNKYFARQQDDPSIPVTVNLEVGYLPEASSPSDTFYISLNSPVTPINSEISVKNTGTFMRLYTDTGCTTPTLDGVPIQFAPLDGAAGETLTIPVGSTYAYSTDMLKDNYDVGPAPATYRSYKITATSMDIGQGVDFTTRNTGSTFCFYASPAIDTITLTAGVWDGLCQQF